MYEGSMYGAGLNVFAVWGYVIAHARNSRIELNPKALSHTLGGSVEDIVKAIEFLGEKDPDSRWKEHDGRRLIKEGQFQYYIPSWTYYQQIRNEEERREYNRTKQAEYRAKPKKKVKKGPQLPGEPEYDKIHREQGQQAADAAMDSGRLQETPKPYPTTTRGGSQPETPATGQPAG